MDIVRRVASMREVSRRLRARGKRIGFVPTMGALHEGHLALMRHLRQRVDALVVSIFVNPTQFGPHEDYQRYPRNFPRDADLCIAEGVDVLFAPEVEEIYPAASSTVVEVQGLSSVLEGASRPGHFRGVSTVVLKLLSVVGPHVSAFGQKDAQQAVIIQRMVRDLLVDVEILVLPTVRDSDGVALSSRNVYLSADERKAARAIPRALEGAEQAIAKGERDPARVTHLVREVLEAELPLRVDYVELVDTLHLQPITLMKGEMLLAVAVWAGKTRLIDNLVVQL